MKLFVVDVRGMIQHKEIRLCYVIVNLQHGIMQEPAQVNKILFIFFLKKKKLILNKIKFNIACDINCSGCLSQTICTGCFGIDSD